MAELRLLYWYLWERGERIDVEHLQCTLNLYTDRLSRHRRAALFSLQLVGVLESSRIGASENNWARPWPTDALVQPPL
jgi:hypothetical protein